MRITMRQKKALVGLGFVSPLIIGLALILIPSLIRAVIFSLNEINIRAGGYTLDYVGLQFYNYAFKKDPWYVRELVATITNMLVNVPLIIAFSFFISSILNQQFRGRTFVRGVLFLPVIITAGVISKLDDLEVITGLSQSGSVVEAITSIDLTNTLLLVGVPPQFVTYVTDVISRIYQVITDSGVQILVFLAALQTIPPSLFEASTIEGATGWENFWKITFPMLSPYILTNAVYSIIDSLGSYKSPVMQVINYYGSTKSELSYSIAMAFIFFSAAALILALFVFLISRIVFYYD